VSVVALTPEKKVAGATPRRECRVYERFPSEIATQCQPLAARSDNDINWPATLRNISAGGIGLVLQRRFEPRTGLAVELPDLDGSRVTVFVRVIHATPQANGGWLLGCSFVTPLTDERLSAILKGSSGNDPATAVPAAAAPKPAAQAPVIIYGVHFRAILPDGNVVGRLVTRLHVTGDWPMPVGRVINLWIGTGKKNASAVDLRVKACHQEGERWFVDCAFVVPPPADLVRSLKEP
jgi:hypothetical protein